MEFNDRFKDGLVELIRRASTELPEDIVVALKKAREQEEKDSRGANALFTVLQNVEMADELSTPICQDTGTLIFYIDYPVGVSTIALREMLNDAIAEATAKSYLRPNAVDPLTGKNSGNNLGRHVPVIHFEEWEKPEVRIRLMLKGGGCENVGAQYSLPYSKLNADRNIAGVKKVILDAVYQAQGRGCAPGILGICIGGDRATGYVISKEQFFRPLDDINPIPELAELEAEILEKANKLDIGPMGFGGRTTLIGVKADYAYRVPASYFVTISYMCWADRRKSMTYHDGEITFD
ncbi:MAG TPA: fumarate hydratase [Bacteroidetes bacterium]|nr:fumarate hydratase [Bacteroidota bacterium]